MDTASNETTIVYSKPNCSFCVMAKTLLKRKNIPFVEMIIGKDIPVQQLMEEFEINKLPPPRTAPQIIFKGKYLGGYVQLEDHFKSIGE